MHGATLMEAIWFRGQPGEGTTPAQRYDIVTQGHGGTLTVESEAGHGAAFIIILPHEAQPTDGVNALSLS